MSDTLEPGEPHPAALLARQWLAEQSEDLIVLQESLAATPANNRIAKVCLGTLTRLLNGEPVSDRYVLGLCWFVFEIYRKEGKL